MPFALEVAIDDFAALMIVFFRMTGVMIAAPLLSSAAFPVRTRVWFSLLASVALLPMVSSTFPEGAFAHLLRTPFTLAIIATGEFAIGWLIGLVAAMSIYAAQLAGHILGLEIGLSIGEIFDPVSETMSAPIANLMLTLGTLIFILLGGHNMIFLALLHSFTAFPPGLLTGLGEYHAVEYVGEYGRVLFAAGVTAALPVMLSLLVVTLGLAILARAVPEMNVFILGFTLRILLGLAALAIVAPFVIESLARVHEISLEMLDGLLTPLPSAGTPK